MTVAVTLFNPMVYQISGFRWSFFDAGDVSMALNLAVILAFRSLCLLVVWWMFKTGYRLKQ
jgi:ABC-2 type transport system permease protein